MVPYSYTRFAILIGRILPLNRLVPRLRLLSSPLQALTLVAACVAVAGTAASAQQTDPLIGDYQSVGGFSSTGEEPAGAPQATPTPAFASSESPSIPAECEQFVNSCIAQCLSQYPAQICYQVAYRLIDYYSLPGANRCVAPTSDYLGNCSLRCGFDAVGAGAYIAQFAGMPFWPVQACKAGIEAACNQARCIGLEPGGQQR
jgi:hypothetical protein